MQGSAPLLTPKSFVQSLRNTGMEFTFMGLKNNMQTVILLQFKPQWETFYYSTCLLALYAYSWEAEGPWKTWRAKIPLQVQIRMEVNDDNSM